MLVSLAHRLVIFATPKCASTAFHRALSEEMDIVFKNAPAAKHTPFRKYDRFIRPYLESITKEPLETVCIVREPVSWLRSWWRYRARPNIPDRAKSTAEMDFETFVRAYLDGGNGPANVGRQSRFVSTKDGAVGMDRVYPYEDLGGMRDWLAGLFGREIVLPQANVSPEAHLATGLAPETEARLRAELAADFALHDAAMRGERITGRQLP